MVNAEALVNESEILHREPERGDFVMYFVRNHAKKVLQTEVGVIARETNDDGFIINGKPRFKDQVLFVLTLDGYYKQKRFSNPLTF